MSSPNDLLIGRGKGYFAKRNAVTDALGGEADLGNMTSFSIATSQEVREKFEFMTRDSNLIDSTPIRTTFTLTITGDYYSLDNVSRLVSGKRGKLTQTAGTVTAETVTASAEKGMWFPLSKRQVSAVVVKVGGAVKEAGTDYELDAAGGRVYITPAGSIADGATVVADFAYATVSLEKIDAGSGGVQNVAVRFIGDPVRGRTFEVFVPKAQVSPDGEFQLISDDYGNWTLTCRILTIPGQAPYTIIERAA